MRGRLLDAAAEVFGEQGWRRLTMAKVADRAGVSRQTVYNELGSKPALAEALVMRELDTFLEVVQARFRAQVELVGAVRAAVEGALLAAERNALLRAVLGGRQEGDAELLPFIFQSQQLIDTATGFLLTVVREEYPGVPLDDTTLRITLESVVRLVLSHISRPSRPPAQTADEVAMLAGAVLAGTVAAVP